jgi:hypothetical protein
LHPLFGPVIEPPAAKNALIDKALTPSYVSNAARSCSMSAIPLQLPEKYRISRKDGRIRGVPKARISSP